MANRAFRIGGWVVAGAAGVALIWGAGSFLHLVRTGPTLTESIVVEPQGYFFRFKASYSHGEETIDFDYVAVCGYRTTVYKGGGKSNDGTYDPKVMVRATGDGGALMVRTPRACKGQTTAKGQAPADLLPFIVWFDDVNDLTFGFGYASPDAYDSPKAEVRFHGATIERATREEWQAWRDRAEAEYEQKGMLPGPWGYSYPAWRAGEPKIQHSRRLVQLCSGYIRLKLPEEVRPQVRDFWPADRPRFWAPQPDQVVPLLSWRSPDGTVHDAIYEAGGNRGVIQTFVSRAVYGEEIGVPTRAGGGTLDRAREHYPADTYPLLYQSRSLERPVVATTNGRSRRLLLREDMKGFVTCGGAGFADNPTSDSDAVPRTKKYSLFVNDVLVMEPQSGGGLPPFRFFERDEYYYKEAPWS